MEFHILQIIVKNSVVSSMWSMFSDIWFNITENLQFSVILFEKKLQKQTFHHISGIHVYNTFGFFWAKN